MKELKKKIVNNKSLYFILFPVCRVSIGAKHALIIDIQREKIYQIEKKIAFEINALNKQNISELYRNSDNKSLLLQNLFFLIENEIGFLNHNYDCFEDLNLAYHTPYKINICYILCTFDFNYFDIFKQLQLNLCNTLVLNIKNLKDNELIKIFNNLKKYNVYSKIIIECISPNTTKLLLESREFESRPDRQQKVQIISNNGLHFFYF